MIAKAIRRLDGRGVGMVFELDIPLDGFKYVWVSGIFAPFTGPETMVFGCDETGDNCDYGGLYDIRGEINVARPLEELGYEVDWNGRLVRDKDQQLLGMKSLDRWKEDISAVPPDLRAQIEKLEFESRTEGP